LFSKLNELYSKGFCHLQESFYLSLLIIVSIMEQALSQLKNLRILYEDNHLIAIHKLPGWLAQGDETGDLTAADRVKAYIKVRYKKPGDVFLGIIHRLDRPVGGVLLFARTSKALTRMNDLFRNREIVKTYLAVTKERPKIEKGKLSNYLLKDKDFNKTKVFESNQSSRSKNAKLAETDYQLEAVADGHFLFQLNPITGRPHQLRAQLAHIGCPIVGDLKYGFPTPINDASIALHCSALSFIHPVKKERITIESTPPKTMPWSPFRQLF
jgi:23S rRNA pseudouridine1911/1915/1917 synthase